MMYNIRMSYIQKILNRMSAKRFTGLIAGDLPTSRKNWGNEDFLKAAEISLYTNRALIKRADKVSEIDFCIKKGGDVVEEHPVYDLLARPNEVFPGMHFWHLYQQNFDIFGEAYIWKVRESELFARRKTVKELHLLNPMTMKPVFDKDNGELLYYLQKTATSEKKYDKEEIIRVFRPSPRMPWQGVSLLKSGVFAIQTEQQIGAYHSRILENGGKVEGVMKFKTDRLTEDQLRQNKLQYEKEYADARKAGRPLFLGGDADYMKTGLTPDELSYLEAKKTTLNDICILTGVPKPLLGAFDDIQYSNAEFAIKIFLREEVYPLQKALATALNEDPDLIEENYELTCIDPTPDNKEEILKETQAGMSSNFMTINEARERHGLEPIDGGDEIYAPFTLSPLGTGNSFNSDGEKSIKKKEYNHPLRDEEVRKMWYDIQIKRMDKREPRFGKVLKAYHEGQMDRLLESVSVDKAYHFRKKDLFDEVINIENEVRIGKELFFPVLEEIVREAARNGADLADYDFDINTTADMVSWIDGRSDVFLRQINQTTFNKLRDEFSASFEAGEDRRQLERRIQQTYNDIDKVRARTIARTEVHNATQFGTMEGYRQAGLGIKIWASVGDQFTRGADPSDQADHLSLDGEERPIDVPFSNGLMFPGDPKGSAAEVINCRCTI